jgi:fumarate reductase subunit D
MPRHRDPLLWSLFGAGGMLTALALPAVVFVLYVAAPLGLFGSLERGPLLIVMGHPLTRLAAFVVVALGLIHAAHRFRYTLYDGLQLYHLRGFISAVTYGVALALLVLAALVLAGAGYWAGSLS